MCPRMGLVSPKLPEKPYSYLLRWASLRLSTEKIKKVHTINLNQNLFGRAVETARPPMALRCPDRVPVTRRKGVCPSLEFGHFGTHRRVAIG